MTDGLRKSHLRKAHQVGLSEVGLPEGNRSFSKILFLSHRDTLVTLVTLYFFSPRTLTLIIWVTGSQNWVTFVTRVTAKTLVTLVHGHRVTLVTLVTLCFFSTNAFSRVTCTRHTRRSHLALFCPIMSHIQPTPHLQGHWATATIAL